MVEGLLGGGISRLGNGWGAHVLVRVLRCRPDGESGADGEPEFQALFRDAAVPALPDLDCGVEPRRWTDDGIL